MINTTTVLSAFSRQSGAITLPVIPPPEEGLWRTDLHLRSNLSGWDETEKRALQALKCVVDETSVFAALVGSAASETSKILAAVIAAAKNERRICVCIPTPDSVSATSVTEISGTVANALSGFSGRLVHVLFGINNAHAATDELLGLLVRFACSRERHVVYQVLLAGKPELWDRLALPRYEILRRRLAFRYSLD